MNKDKSTENLLSLRIKNHIIQIVSETNGLSLYDTLDLILSSDLKTRDAESYSYFVKFHDQVQKFQLSQSGISELLASHVSHAWVQFFSEFPLRFREEHIHLTGSLDADFVYPRISALLNGPNKKLYENLIKEVYGDSSIPLRDSAHVDQLLRLKESEGFDAYLKILLLPKLVLINRQAHEDAAYHMAQKLYTQHNVGFIRLKFTLARSGSSEGEQIPGADSVSAEDVVLGLYQGFTKFQKINPEFKFILSPSFRKEPNYYDSTKYANKRDHFMVQIRQLCELLEKFPYLRSVLNDVDTVGNESELYRKEHFNVMAEGFRKLRYQGFSIRSHHGETFKTLKKGIQAVDNAMNIWHIDTLEHGLALGINPNFYFHRIYQKVTEKNNSQQKIDNKDPAYNELKELDWGDNQIILQKLLDGVLLNDEEKVDFLKSKFHTAREVEHYQHDVLNRLLDKGVSLVALPSSNKKLTGRINDYKDHPFSWWEKKGVNLSVGTDNYLTLNTSFPRELLILLLTDPDDLKITKLLMVATGENRRPYISHMLWKMRKQTISN